MTDRTLVYESPTLRELRQRGEHVGLVPGDPWLGFPRSTPDPSGRRGEKQGTKAERARRKRERKAGVETVRDRRLTGEG